MDNLQSLVTRYTADNEIRSIINEIESISAPDFSRVSPEISDWISASESPINVEIEFLPNLGEETYSSLINHLSEFLSGQGYDTFPSRIREHSASLRAKLSPQ